jgi:aminoglycoside 3-N-acetyltransferase
MKKKINLDIVKLILDKFKIEKEDNIYLGIDIFKLIKHINLKNNTFDFFIKILLDYFLKRVGSSGNIIIPVFNFDCIKRKIFNQISSPGQSGLLGNTLLKKNFHLRTQNPIYSFLCFGNYSNKFIKMNNINATGVDSPWEIFISNNFDIITLGHHYARSFTHVHYLENLIGVDYRFSKKYTVKYTNIKNKKSFKTYSFFARKKNICEFSGITKKCENFFLKNDITQFYKYNDFISFKLNINKACNLILDDMKRNSEKFVTYIRKGKNNINNLYIGDNTMSNLERKYLLNINSNV